MIAISRNTQISPILLVVSNGVGRKPAQPLAPSLPLGFRVDGSLHGFQGRAGQSCGAIPAAFRPVLGGKKTFRWTGENM